MASQDKQITVMAKINDQIVRIDLASEHRDSYSEMGGSIQYLGYGVYHSYDGILAGKGDNRMTHF